MTTNKPGLILTGSVMGLGMHLGAWMARDGDASDYVDISTFAEVARSAEAGKLHALFFADALTNSEEGADRPSLGALDPAIVLATMAAVTTHVGIVGTASTTYCDPYDLARRFATLDHLSGGRAGWNSVATFIPSAAEMFGGRPLPDRASRYDRADEFIAVVQQLWDSWDPDALVGDKTTGTFADPSKVRAINHRGQHFAVRGPLPLPRSPQGRPIIFQAGSSPEGRDQAAKCADVVFTAQHLIEDGVEFRADIRRRAEAHGRNPDDVKVLPGISPILGATRADAHARKQTLDDVLGAGPQLEKLARRIGVPTDALILDQPFPVHLIGPDEEFHGSVGFRRALVNLAVKDNLTVRELVARYGGGHQQVVGTPHDVADIIELWWSAGAADGFNLMVDIVPSGFHQVAELLVPELQSRGLFHRDYEHDTLRGNLGLPVEAVAQRSLASL